MIPEVEQLIELNRCDGKPTILKTVRQEPLDPEFYFQKRVDGVKYGPFGIYEEDGLYYVVHARSGRSCGLPFSSEESARRLAFLLKSLAKWSKVDWKDDRAYEADPLFWLCVQCSEYCNDLEGDYEMLLEAIKPELPPDSVYVEEVVEFKEVSFGQVVSN